MMFGLSRRASAEALGSAFLLATPVLPGVQRDDWPLEDPKGKPLARVREIRDELRERVARFVLQHGWGRA